MGVEHMSAIAAELARTSTTHCSKVLAMPGSRTASFAEKSVRYSPNSPSSSYHIWKKGQDPMDLNTSYIHWSQLAASEYKNLLHGIQHMLCKDLHLIKTLVGEVC